MMTSDSKSGEKYNTSAANSAPANGARKIAATPAVEHGHPAASQPHHVPGLGPRLDRDDLGAVERVEREARAERGLSHRDRAAVHEVDAVPLELGMHADSDEDVEITRHSPTRRGRAAASWPAARP